MDIVDFYRLILVHKLPYKLPDFTRCASIHFTALADKLISVDTVNSNNKLTVFLLRYFCYFSIDHNLFH